MNLKYDFMKMFFDERKIKDTNRIIERIILNVVGVEFLATSKRKLHKPYGMSININFIRVACLNWCKLFGTDREEHHWKSIIYSDSHQLFRAQMLKDLEVSMEEYENIRNEILNFRNFNISHQESYPVIIPQLSKATITSGTLYSTINISSENDFSKKIEHCKRLASEQLSCLLVK
jgi:hypothetical protein